MKLATVTIVLGNILEFFFLLFTDSAMIKMFNSAIFFMICDTVNVRLKLNTKSVKMVFSKQPFVSVTGKPG